MDQVLGLFFSVPVVFWVWYSFSKSKFYGIAIPSSINKINLYHSLGATLFFLGIILQVFTQTPFSALLFLPGAFISAVTMATIAKYLPIGRR